MTSRLAAIGATVLAATLALVACTGTGEEGSPPQHDDGLLTRCTTVA